MNSSDLKFKLKFSKVINVLPVTNLKINAKFEGSINKTVTCSVFTVSKT